KYLAPKLANLDRTALDAKLKEVVPQERRLNFTALLDGTYTPQIQARARERLKFPVARVEAQLAQEPWLAGPEDTNTDLAAYAMLRVIPDLAPDIVNSTTTPRIHDYLARISARPAVK